LWTALQRVYSAISSAKIMELRRLLQTTTRGGQSCNDYFERMRSIADQLAVVGEIVIDSDLTRYVLNGLGSDFNSFVVAITTRSDPLSIEELHDFLLSHEALLNSQHQLSSSFEPVAFYASGCGRGRYTRSRGRGSVNSSLLLPTLIQGQTGSYFPSGRGFYSPYNPSPGVSGQKFSPYGRASTFTPSGDKLVCQVCKKRGHEAFDCWHRFDNAMYPSPPQAFFNSTISTPNEGWT
jgi:gag-polypeptide of LTR copia-type